MSELRDLANFERVGATSVRPLAFTVMPSLSGGMRPFEWVVSEHGGSALARGKSYTAADAALAALFFLNGFLKVAV